MFLWYTFECIFGELDVAFTSAWNKRSSCHFVLKFGKFEVIFFQPQKNLKTILCEKVERKLK